MSPISQNTSVVSTDKSASDADCKANSVVTDTSDSAFRMFENSFPRVYTPASKINPHDHLKQIISEMYQGELFEHPLAGIITKILNDKGTFGKECRIELFQGCFNQQRLDFEIITPDNIPELMVKHLSLTNSLLTLDNVSEMHAAVRNGWVKLMNRNLRLLSLADTWTEEHTVYFILTLDLLNKTAFPNTEDCEVLPELHSEVIKSIGHFISNPPECFFSNPTEPSYAEGVYALIEIASLLKLTQQTESLKDLYWQVNLICSELDPDFYNPSASEEYTEDQDFDEEPEDAEDGGYEIIDGELSDIDEYDHDNFELHHAALEGWEEIQENILSTISKANIRQNDYDFWLEVLDKTSIYSGCYGIALEALAECENKVVKQFLAKLAIAASEDDMAVIRLIDFVSISDYSEVPCPNNTRQIAIDCISILPEKLKIRIFDNANKLIIDNCELIEDLDLFKSSLEDLIKGH